MTESCTPGSNQAHKTLGIKEVHVFPSSCFPWGKLSSRQALVLSVVSMRLGPDVSDIAGVTA